MKMQWKRIAAALIAGLLLAGCGGKDEQGDDTAQNNNPQTEDSATPTPTPTPTPSPTPDVVDNVQDDVTDDTSEPSDAPDADVITADNTDEPVVAETPSPTPEPYRQPQPSDYYFMVNGAYIALNENATQVFTEIGQPNQIFESPSCAFKGIDKILYYNGFTINTYPDEEQDFIISITLTDESHQTPEGARLGMSFDEVVGLYGTNYDNMLDLYSYIKGDVKVAFLFEDDALVDITYYYMPAANLL